MRLLALAALTLSGVAQAAPTVSLTAPGDGWAYNAPVTLSLKASAAVDPADTGATLLRVEFYADGQLIGSDATTAYSLAWNGASVGSHVLTAKAVDSLGQEALSAPRTLIITDSTSNLAPTVSLTAPANSAKYALPADITLTASAADIEKNGVVTQVEFLANGQVVGSATTRPFSFVWSNP
ncbi:MAG: Ig-like domain-containing protein, partial [Sulfuritalea sp.]|nr:Ig-like domain-containing protein [Sulfuritalea sp.]